MSQRRGKRLGYVVVNVNPQAEPTVVGSRIYAAEREAEAEAHRLQEEHKDPFIWTAELVLPPEPEIEVRNGAEPYVAVKK